MKKSDVMIVIALGVLLLLPFASAGFFDWLTGKVGSNPTDVNVPLGNTAPLIVNVFNGTGKDVTVTADPNEESFTDVTVIFQAFDHDKSSDLDSATALAWVTKAGEETRNVSSACTAGAEIGGKYKNYTCTIRMQYWDAPGAWTLTTVIKDSSGAPATNATQGFLYSTLLSFKMAPNSVNWSVLLPTNTNQKAINDPTVLNNTGNAIPFVYLNATNLTGESDLAYAIAPEDFKVSGTLDDECIRTALTTGTFAKIQNVTAVDITLGRGNLSIGGVAQSNVYYCLTYVNETLIKQNYTTVANGPWKLRISES